MRHQTAQLRFTQFDEFKKRLLAPPLFLPAAAFAGGICLASAFEVNLALIWISVFLAGTGIAVSIGAQRHSAFWILIASCLAGVLHMSSFESFSKHHVKFLTDGKGSLQGTVASFPETVTKGKKRMTRFLLRAENWRIQKKTHPVEGGVQVFIFYAPETIRYGDQVRLWGELRTPKRATNPEEFDYATYLEKQGIFKVFQAFGAKSVRVMNASKPNWRSQIENLRFQVQSRILKLFPYPEREIIQALWLGFRRNIPDEINNVFIRTGTIHILPTADRKRNYYTLTGGIALS